MTKKQKTQLDSVFTPKKIIDVSKGLSHEKELDSVVSVRDKQIKELNLKIQKLKDEHNRVLTEIAIASVKAKKEISIVDDISKSIIKKEKKIWKGFHLYLGFHTPIIDYENTFFFSELTHTTNRFILGVEVNTNKQYLFNLKYKLF